MLCRELMKTHIEWFHEGDTIQEIARRMREGNFGFAPVCDHHARPVGVITDRDIALRVCAEDHRASRTHAADVMTRGLVTCSTMDAVELAEELMADRQKSRILVLDEDGKLAGIISLADIAARESELNAARTLRRVIDREAWV